MRELYYILHAHSALFSMLESQRAQQQKDREQQYAEAQASEYAHYSNAGNVIDGECVDVTNQPLLGHSK